MNYFEVKERLDGLRQFRRSYAEYINFTNREKNVPAQMLLSNLNPARDMTVDSLRRVGLGRMFTRDAPSRGGKRVKINTIRAIFREDLIQHFSLDDETPLRILDAGVIRYKMRLWRQKLLLFNPVFWLYQIFGFIALLPILVFKKAGVDTTFFEERKLVRFYVVTVQLVCFYLTVEALGFISLITFDKL